MRINAGIYIENNISYVTKRFQKNLYLGCPINAVMHYTKFDYDEILIINKCDYVNSFDILNLKKISESSLKPKCYAGGIRELEQAKSIIEVGFERVTLRTLFFNNINEYRKIIKLLGRQSVSLCIDIKKYQNSYFITIDGKRLFNLIEFIIDDNDLPGEIFINYIDLNGCLSSLDMELINLIHSKKWKTNINYSGSISKLSEVTLLKNLDFTAVTLFTRAATINNGNDKLLNNTIFNE